MSAKIKASQKTELLNEKRKQSLHIKPKIVPQQYKYYEKQTKGMTNFKLEQSRTKKMRYNTENVRKADYGCNCEIYKV